MILYSNNASTTLASGISNSATTIVVATGTGSLFPTISSVDDYFNVTLADSAKHIEIVTVTARTGDTFTVMRGMENTTARAWLASDILELRITKGLLDQLKLDATKDTASNLSAHTSNTSNPHSVTATQVGLGNVTNESKVTMFTSPTFTGTVSGVTASMVGLGNVNNTSDANKPVSTATSTVLGTKIDKVTSTDNAIVRFDGTSGAVQNSSVTIDDSGNVGIGTSSPAVSLDLSTKTDAISLPHGTTAQRPSSPSIGYLRYNTDTGALENYTSNGWLKVSVQTPIVSSFSGSIYSGYSSTITFSGQNFGTSPATVTFTSGATTATATGTPTGGGTSLSVSVPSAIYGLSAGSVVSMTVANADAAISPISTTSVIGMPSGGTITTSGSNRIHTFLSSTQNFVVPTGFSATASYLLVAGGGGGGDRFGGGGGAGGVLTGTTSITANTYSITVGSGGAGGQSNNTAGSNGSNTTAFGLTAIGGGGGASEITSPGNGGSGGGSSYTGGTAGTGTSGQGYNGGLGASTYGTGVRENGGGGGAGQAGFGGNSTTSQPPNGGSGILSFITGTATYYGGGGGGADNRVDSAGYGGTVAGIGGNGGGGAGGGGESNGQASSASGVGGNGSTNTGGGGGGGSYIPSLPGGRPGGNGGSGIVVISYPLPA